MAQARRGDTVRVHYQGTLDDGTVFDSSHGGEPLEFTLGEGMVIPGFENAVDGMNTGEKRTEKIPPDQAYGPHDPDRLVQIPKSEVPPEAALKVGDRVQLYDDQGHALQALVAALDDHGVTLDMNHVLAGEALTFEIELVEVLPIVRLS